MNLGFDLDPVVRIADLFVGQAMEGSGMVGSRDEHVIVTFGHDHGVTIEPDIAAVHLFCH